MPGPVNPLPARNPNKDREVLNFASDYVASPKYRERLAGFYKYPDFIQRQRQGVIDNVSVRENPSGTTHYFPNGNEVAISDNQLRAYGVPRQEGLAHEAAHSLNSNWMVKGSALSPAEQNFILDRNKNISTDTKNSLQGLSKESKKPLYDLMNDNLHDQNPAESKSDIDAFRFLLNRRKLYNAGAQDMTPEILNKAKNDPVISRSFIMKRLKENFDDKGLIEIMNKVASNNNTNQSKTV